VLDGGGSDPPREGALLRGNACRFIVECRDCVEAMLLFTKLLWPLVVSDIRDTSFDIALQDNDYIQRSAFAPPQQQHQQQQQQLSYRQHQAPYTSYADLQVLASPLSVPVDEHCSRFTDTLSLAYSPSYCVLPIIFLKTRVKGPCSYRSRDAVG